MLDYFFYDVISPPWNFEGFCANKSTAVFMDINSRNIVHVEIGDSRQVGRHSPKMEKNLIERGLNYLVNVSPFVVWEIISDASRNIISLMRKFKWILCIYFII